MRAPFFAQRSNDNDDQDQAAVPGARQAARSTPTESARTSRVTERFAEDGGVMKQILPNNLRRPEERYAALKMADALLRADRKRTRAQAINNESGGRARPINNKRQDGPFAALRKHPLYRAPRHGASRRP
jgi:hypothetical protein